MATPEEIRRAQRAAWAGLSSSWERWDGLIMEQLGPVGDAIIEHLDVQPDHRVLDIAAGTGEPGLTIAQRTPGGRVVLTDLSPEMLRVAGRRAGAAGTTNVDAVVCSADELPFCPAAFDGVSVRFGYMFFPDLGKAIGELARVLRPGGRLCGAVWVKPAENPWTSIAMDAIAAEVVLPPPDPDGPNMYRCAAPGQVSALYDAAGLVDVSEWDVGVELVTSTAEEYWAMISDHVSLAAAALKQVDGPARERIRGTVLAEVAAFERDGAIRVPGAARCIVGTKSQ